VIEVNPRLQPLAAEGRKRRRNAGHTPGLASVMTLCHEVMVMARRAVGNGAELMRWTANVSWWQALSHPTWLRGHIPNMDERDAQYDHRDASRDAELVRGVLASILGM